MFAIIFFRLWFLQVLSGDQYAQAPASTACATSTIPAPRGEILDRSGTILASSRRASRSRSRRPTCRSRSPTRTSPTRPSRTPALYNRLARVLGMPTKRQPCPVDGHGLLRMSPIACARGAGLRAAALRRRDGPATSPTSSSGTTSERQAAFPGVSVQQVYLRTYPLGDVAAQLLGTVGPITPQRGRTSSYYRGVTQNDRRPVRPRGVLRPLSARRGRRRAGAGRRARPLPGSCPRRAPVPGHNLKLSLELQARGAGQQALQEAIDANYPANGGAFVAMNPDNGEVYAMGSLPTFDPNIFTKPVPSRPTTR